MAYIGNQLSSRKNNNKQYVINALVAGSEKAVEEVRKILTKEQPTSKHKYITATNAEELKKELSCENNKDFETVIFDTDYYSYEQIFNIIENAPNNRLKIATYSTKSGVLITEGCTYHRIKE